MRIKPWKAENKQFNIGDLVTIKGMRKMMTVTGHHERYGNICSYFNTLTQEFSEVTLPDDSLLPFYREDDSR